MSCSDHEQSDDCPLCMEPLEMDDMNFFPCTCGYQICRFCWHRIRTDENGLCPACRKQYPEDPAEYKPLTQEEVQKIKNDKKQKDIQRKQKLQDNRKHLGSVRVVQRNLVFVVGLSSRLSDSEVLRKQEYFGKFGKIHKVVINQNTTYAGSQGPSASAYITYIKSEDALRAIQAVNNIHVDGRTLKSSLGTTKYCSHFLKGTQCPKPDCMYLHELGDEQASFTKEEMQQGKHQEYEQKLHEAFLNNQNCSSLQQAQAIVNEKTKSHGSRNDTDSPPIPLQHSPCTQHTAEEMSEDPWPSVNGISDGSSDGDSLTPPPPSTNSTTSLLPDHSSSSAAAIRLLQESNLRLPNNISSFNDRPTELPFQPQQSTSCDVSSPLHRHKSPFDDITHQSLFSSNGFSQRKTPQLSPNTRTIQAPDESMSVMDCMPVNHSSTDWQAAFGFGSSSSQKHQGIDDDLDFDPCHEAVKGLGDLIEKERLPLNHSTTPASAAFTSSFLNHTRLPQPPPGLTQSHHQSQLIGPPGFHNTTSQQQQHVTNSNNFGLNPERAAFQPSVPTMMSFNRSVPPGSSSPSSSLLASIDRHSNNNINKHAGAAADAFSVKDWQDGLRALLPNININFGATSPGANNSHGVPSQLRQTSPVKLQWQHQQQQQQHNHQLSPDWRLSSDPAVVSAAAAAAAAAASSDLLSGTLDSQPHWMKSLHQLTEVDATSASPISPTVGGLRGSIHSRLPAAFTNNHHHRHMKATATSWESAPLNTSSKTGTAAVPPPGFSTQYGPIPKPTES